MLDNGRVPEDFLIAANPEPDSTLPYLVRIPLDSGAIVVKAKEPWPRTGKVYCHRAVEWPTEPVILERIATRSCQRRGASIDLVVERARENRSQFVLTNLRGGREAIFWQTPRTSKQARPNVTVPSARASRLVDLEIIVDTRERYAWKFDHQQTTTRKQALAVGDYAVEVDQKLVAAVERKSLGDLTGSLTNGALRAQLVALAELPHAAVVVEDRYSAVFKIDFVRPSVLVELLAECQIRFPAIPIVFCETRALAQEWTYRFLGAAVAELGQEPGALSRLAPLRAEPDR